MKRILTLAIVFALLVCSVSVFFPHVNATSGIAGYWGFDEGSGTTTFDSSGNGNNGTLINGPVWIDGKYGKALDFDGVDDYVEVEDSSSLHFSTSVTLMAWVYLVADATYSDSRVLGKDAWNGGTNLHLVIHDSLGHVGFGLGVGGGSTSVFQTSTEAIPRESWTHIAATYDGFLMRIYVNGSLDSTLSWGSGFDSNANPLTIGSKNPPYLGFFFKGKIDEVRIYNRVLSQQEIQTNMGGEPTPWGDWKHYHSYTEIVDTLLYLNYTYPNIVDVFSIGKSWQNQDIYCIRLTNESNTHPKPKVLFVGYHHARELISTELPFYFAVEAATNYEVNETITQMLNYSEIYIIPTLNVDGFEAVKQNEWQRKNTHPYDEDGDGLLDEDPPDDENGNGYIEDLVFMNSTNYYFIRWEGTDNDGDGLYNEDSIGGVDLNRNYGWNVTCAGGSPNPWDETYRGPEPFSEPETRAMRDLALTHDFKYALSFHSGDEYIGYGYGNSEAHNNTFLEVAENLSTLVSAPYYLTGFGGLPSGTFNDWMYGNRSTFAFTCEIYTNSSAWQYEPGSEPDTYWEKGVFQFFNPDPNNIETVIQRWLPVFTYITNRAIAEAYDTAITNVIPLKTVIGQKFNMNINVTVANQGKFAEAFNVAVYANATLIETEIVVLLSGSSATVNFVWNTTGFTYGNYTIWAYAEPVSGETHTADNTFIYGTITVTISGDVDGDQSVTILDVVKITSIYALKQGDPGFNPNSDIDNDSNITILDVVICTSHYGQKWS